MTRQVVPAITIFPCSIHISISLSLGEGGGDAGVGVGDAVLVDDEVAGRHLHVLVVRLQGPEAGDATDLMDALHDGLVAGHHGGGGGGVGGGGVLLGLVCVQGGWLSGSHAGWLSWRVG